MYMNGFECVRCGTLAAADYDGYVCPKCGANMQITYDYEALRNLPDGPFDKSASGPARYLNVLPLDSAEFLPTLRVGQTPLYDMPRMAARAGVAKLYIKDDGLNPSGSFKDRASAVAVAVAAEKKVKMTAGASTGNAGSSMACMSANTGQSCVIFVPAGAPEAKITQLLIFGAHVVAVEGSYDDAFDLCMKFCEKHGWFNRNTGFNPYTREGKKVCSFEMWEQLDGKFTDWLAVPTGDGNIISGIWKGLCDLQRLGLIERPPRLLCSQSEQSNAITQTVRKLNGTAPTSWTEVEITPISASTLADSISVDIPRDGLTAVRGVIESGGTAVEVPDADILAAIKELASSCGVFAEPAAATTWAAVRKAVREEIIKPDETVLCLLTGNGLKDVASARKAAGAPIHIKPDLAEAEKALASLLN